METTGSVAPNTGSIGRAAHQVTGSALPFQLQREVAALRLEMSVRSENRLSKTLIREEDFSMILLVMEKGSSIQEHPAPGEVVAQALDGHLNVQAGDRFELAGGDLLAIAPGVAYSLEAQEPSVLLLTVARNALPRVATIPFSNVPEAGRKA